MRTITPEMAHIDTMLASDSPAQTRLHEALSSGECSRDDLRAFATQYYHYVDLLPRLVARVYCATSDSEIRRTLLRLLVALEGGNPNIVELWLQTCASLGCERSTVRASMPNTATEACMNDLEYLCKHSTLSGITTILTMLDQLPRTSAQEQQALASAYGLSSGPGTQFHEVVGFQAHSHATPIRELVARLLSTHSQGTHEVHEAIRATQTAVQGMYNGMLSTVATA